MSFFTSLGASPDDGHDEQSDWKCDPEPMRALPLQRQRVDFTRFGAEFAQAAEAAYRHQIARHEQEFFRLAHQFGWLCCHYPKPPHLLTREDREGGDNWVGAHRGQGFTGYEGQAVPDFIWVQMIKANMVFIPYLN